NGIFWKKMPKSLGGLIGTLTILASFIVSVGIFFEVKDPNFHGPVIVHLFDFIQSGKLYIPFSFQVDALSALFLLIITGVGFLIHLYSTSYMHHDEGMVKYFAYLNLFVFSMLLLVWALTTSSCLSVWKEWGYAHTYSSGFGLRTVIIPM